MRMNLPHRQTQNDPGIRGEDQDRGRMQVHKLMQVHGVACPRWLPWLVAAKYKQPSSGRCAFLPVLHSFDVDDDGRGRPKETKRLLAAWASINWILLNLRRPVDCFDRRQ